jgi:prepilin signal peptidase PulO-like enzyme (type II secretory pathway)
LAWRVRLKHTYGAACPACPRELSWYENIPVFSYLVLRGRCRTCAAPISVRYPLIEALTAAGKTEYKGQTYYFCGANCKKQFDLNPAQYVEQPAGAPKSGHGCCS